MTDTKRIESYGLYDFCKDIQEALLEGYVFDFDTNENFPTAYGTVLTCGLVKAGEVAPELAEVVEGSDTETEEVQETPTEEVETDSQNEQSDEKVQDEKQDEGSDTESKPEGSEVAAEVKPEGTTEAPAATGKRGPNKNKAK